MISRLVSTSIDHRGIVLGITAALSIAGLSVASRLDLDALPDVTTNQVVVLVTAPGFTPEEVEQQVARPIELALAGIPGLVTRRSTSRYGITAVAAIFDDDVDPFFARQAVSERLVSIASSLPEGVDPPELGPYTGGLGEIFQYTLRSPRRSSSELLEIAQRVVAPRFRDVPGVVEVNTWGGAVRTLDVIGDPVRMAALGVDIVSLESAVASASATLPGDSLPSGTGRTLVRAVSWPTRPSELGEVVVRIDEATERTIRVADVATIRSGELSRIGTATADGHGEVVYGMAQMIRGGNAYDVTQAIRERLPDVRRSLPPDVSLEVIYDRSELVARTLHTVATSLLEGGLLVSLVLLGLLGSLRAGVIVAATIPLAMLGAGAAMVAFGIPGNLMSLGAIDFGLIVDGGVVMVESVFHALATSGGSAGGLEDRRSVARNAMTSMARPVFFSVAIIALVYLPILSLTGVDGKLFRPMAATIVFALVVALALSLTFVPAATSFLVDRMETPPTEPKLVRAASKGYRAILSRAIEAPRVVIGIAVAAFVVAGVLLARTGTEFVPQLDEGTLVIQTNRSPDISIESAIREATRFESALRTHVPEVERVVTRIGSPAVATDLMGLEQGDVIVLLSPRERWRDGMSRDELVADIERVLDRYAPGGEREFSQPIQMRFNELLGGSMSDVSVTIFGEDVGRLRELGERVAASIERERGALDVRIAAPDSVDLVEARPSTLHASHEGMRPVDVVRAVSALRFGIVVGETFDGTRRIPIRLRLSGADTIYQLGDAQIPVPGGHVVPLGRIAELTRTSTPGSVEHTDGQRRLTVGFNVRGDDVGSVASRVERRLEREVPPPRGYRYEYGGQIETMREAYERLAILVPVVLVMTLLVLSFLFRSVRSALIVFANVPFATVGGVFALALRGLPISVSSIIGFVALSGIAVLNGVVLMTRLLALEAEGVPRREAARRAAEERMRPVLMTAGVAALGFVPMMLSTGVGSEVQRPLATVVVGGLVTSTLLTLVVLPSVLGGLARRAEPA